MAEIFCLTQNARLWLRSARNYATIAEQRIKQNKLTDAQLRIAQAQRALAVGIRCARDGYAFIRSPKTAPTTTYLHTDFNHGGDAA